jgi:hypothetical protein
MKVKNLTPHPVVLEVDGAEIVIPSSGLVPRVKIEDGPLTAVAINGIAVPLVRGSVLAGVRPKIPAPEEGTLLIVARLVAEQFPERKDLVFPDDLIRVDGRVVAARRLASIR